VIAAAGVRSRARVTLARAPLLSSAFAALALAGAIPAQAAEGGGAGVAGSKQERAQAAGLVPSAETTRVAGWIAASRDNRSYPYAIIDKKGAAIFLFDASGKPLGQAPVLIGIAPGDDASPGVGKKSLAQLGPSEKTTPAGRFLAKYGWAAGRQRMLWVDYADSVGLHPIPKDAAKSEKRRERMLSPTSEDNRITFGCINVPGAFYARRVRPLFQRKGGYVYVLPDTKPIETVFPALQALPYASAAP
jgi:hypothetical protein